MFIRYKICIAEKPITDALSFSHVIPRIKKNTIPIIMIFSVVVTILNAYIPYSLSVFLIQLKSTNSSQTPVDDPQLNFHPKHMVINFTSPQVTPHETPIAAITSNIIINVATTLLFFFILFSDHIIQNLLCYVFLWLKRQPTISMNL